MYGRLFQPFEDFAASVLDGVAGLLGNKGNALCDPPTNGHVTLPDDLFAKRDVQTEWWYYTGHCKTQSGREFGFELVFFKRRTDHDRLGIIPMTVLANPMYFAHFAISDITRQRFRYDHIRSFNKPLDVPVLFSETTCDVRLGPWSLREIAGKHVLHATLEDGLVFDAVLESAKPLVLNGDGGSGIARKGEGSSNHFSFTRMDMTGQILESDNAETFTGSAWMDREFGSWEHGVWDWFSIQFNDETELMLYQFKTKTGEMDGESTGTYVTRDGKCTYLKRSDFEIDVLSTWISPSTGAEYPAGWQICVPSLDIDIRLKPLIDDQELDTRGSTMIVYWEGVCEAKGLKNNATTTGRAYVELVGYDLSHETAGIGDFLFGKTMRRIQEVYL
ncbi:MAG: lipocalin family protein [Pyrinomonadaceae bacterium]